MNGYDLRKFEQFKLQMTQSYKQELVELEQEWISKEEKFTVWIKEIERTHFENEEKLKQKFENEYEKLKR